MTDHHAGETLQSRVPIFLGLGSNDVVRLHVMRADCFLPGRNGTEGSFAAMVVSANYAHLATWLIAAVAVGGVIIRPWGLPEAIWAVLGAGALVLLSLLPAPVAWSAIIKGLDVYLFLTGMMLLAELARQEGLFDWLAAIAVTRANGSPSRLFALTFVVGIVITVFLSNDATAVVLTPAVYAAAKAARAKPLPYLFICAFIANAASFVLPISNPANLVMYAGHMPALTTWLSQFTVPSVIAIATTFVTLRLMQRNDLTGEIATTVPRPDLSTGGILTALGIALTTVALLVASALDQQLGLPTILAGLLTAAVIAIRNRRFPWRLLGGISWSVLALLGGLFILVGGLEHTGVITALTGILQSAARASRDTTAVGGALTVAVASNLINNLPAGLIAASTVAAASTSPLITSAILIGVDLGPNLSVTGSLATILWLVALRRENVTITELDFLRLGLVVMIPALLLSIGSLIVMAAIGGN